MDNTGTEILRNLRIECELSQAEFAEQLGLSTTTLSRVENGHAVSKRVIQQICEQIGWDFETNKKYFAIKPRALRRR